MTEVPAWVISMTEEVLGGPPVVKGKCYEHPYYGPIRITGGQYWGRRGLSNFWSWTVLKTGETKRGYADNWPEIPDPEEEGREIDVGRGDA